MKVSELITILENFKKEKGDMQVYVIRHGWSDPEPELEDWSDIKEGYIVSL